MGAKYDSQEIFNNLCSKIDQLLFSRTEGSRNLINKTLDDLISLNYRYCIISNPTKGVLLINQCCILVPTEDAELVQKLSQLFTILVAKQNIVIEGRTLTVAVQWCLQSLKNKKGSIIIDILNALDALLRSNPQDLNSLPSIIIRDLHPLFKESLQENNLDLSLIILKCFEACTVVEENPKSQKKNDFSMFEACASCFFSYLCNKIVKIDELTYSKILLVSVKGLQNIILQHQDFLKTELALILGIIKTFMLYGIKGLEFISPKKLMPSTLSVPEAPVNCIREKKGGKMTKQRKHRSSVNKNENKIKEEWINETTNSYIPANNFLDCTSDNNLSAFLKLKTSDSDFSDSEGGKLAKLNVTNNRIRQAILNLFFHVVKGTEKPVMFSYWSNFIPETFSTTTHNLLTCILKDHSPKGRIAALNVLLLMLSSSKLYLAQAEISEKSTSFTPYSVSLGLTLKELHRGLILGLNEMSVPVQTQALKCLAALVQATPYSRMNTGLISKIVRNVKPLIYHKDANVQVTALIVLGCIIASEPAVPETLQCMLRTRESEKASNQTLDLNKSHPETNLVSLEEPFDYAEISEESEEEIYDDIKIPWLLEKCLKNLGAFSNDPETIQPQTAATVKLESLKVISAMSRNYFNTLMASHLHNLTRAIDICLNDKYTDLRLLAGRAVEFIGQAICRSLNSEEQNSVELERALSFWKALLDQSLIGLIQCEQHPTLRAVGCDCLSSIGPQVFEQLPRDKQLLCITLLFSCTRDEENSVKGAAVRALAICVMYPSLREDSGFVVDTAEAIQRTLRSENLMVRAKASWSLGNLSDALVINSKENEINEELPELLLLDLIKASINGSGENDKIKMNAVRALGNFLKLIDERLCAKKEIKNVLNEGLMALVKCSTSGSSMKVRWNACYAIGSAFQNNYLFYECSDVNYNIPSWRGPVFEALMELVVNFRNFKVRINAALALMSPTSRIFYGNYFLPIWIALLKGLENSQNIEDFNEYRHRDHLVEQICFALGHLTTLMTIEDVNLIGDIITLHYDNFKMNMHRVLERLVPEKSASLFSAEANLTSLGSSLDLSDDQKMLLNDLKEIFTI